MGRIKTFDAGMSLAKCSGSKTSWAVMSIHVALHHRTTYLYARLVFPEKTTRFEVTVDLVADMAVSNPFDFFLEPSAEEWPFAYDPSLAEEIAPFRKMEPAGPLLTAWLAKGER